MSLRYPCRAPSARDSVVRHHDSDRSSISQHYSTIIHNGFLKKVYGIMTVQMLFIEGSIYLLMAVPLPKKWLDQQDIIDHFRKNTLIITGVLTLIIALLMRLSGGARRAFPLNFLFLAAFTISLGICLGAVSSLYSTTALLMAVGVSGSVCFVLALCALQNKWTFTLWSEVVITVAVVLLAFGFYSFHRFDLSLLYASIGSLLFSLYSIYTVQLMLRGRHRCKISPEEYIFTALNLYLDIFTCYFYVVKLIWRFMKH